MSKSTETLEKQIENSEFEQFLIEEAIAQNKIGDYLIAGITNFMLNEQTKIFEANISKSRRAGKRLKRILENYVSDALKDSRLNKDVKRAVQEVGKDLWENYLAHNESAIIHAEKDDLAGEALTGVRVGQKVNDYFKDSQAELLIGNNAPYAQLGKAFRAQKTDNGSNGLFKSMAKGVATAALTIMLGAATVFGAHSVGEYTPQKKDAVVQTEDAGEQDIAYEITYEDDADEGDVPLPLPANVVAAETEPENEAVDDADEDSIYTPYSDVCIDEEDVEIDEHVADAVDDADDFYKPYADVCIDEEEIEIDDPVEPVKPEACFGETRLNFDFDSTRFVDPDADKDIAGYVKGALEAGHKKLYVAGFASIESQDDGDNPVNDDDKHNWELAKKRADRIADSAYNAAKQMGEEITLYTQSYGETEVFGDDYEPNRTGVISTIPIADPESDHDLAKRLANHDAGENYDVPCDKIPAEEEAPEQEELEKKVKAEEAPKKEAEPEKEAEKAAPVADLEEAPAYVGVSEKESVAPKKEAEPEKAAPKVKEIKEPAAPEGKSTVEKDEEGHEKIITSDGRVIHYKELPGKAEEAPSAKKPFDAFIESVEALRESEGFEEKGYIKTKEPKAEKGDGAAQKLKDDLDSIYKSYHKANSKAEENDKLLDTINNECGSKGSGSTLCNRYEDTCKDNHPNRRKGPGELSACQKAIIEAKHALEMSELDADDLENRVGSMEESGDSHKQENAPEVLNKLTNLKEYAENVAERTEKDVALANTVVDECEEKGYGNTLCKRYAGSCKDSDPKIPAEPGELSACRKGYIDVKHALEMDEMDIVHAKKQVAELKKEAEKAGMLKKEIAGLESVIKSADNAVQETALPHVSAGHEKNDNGDITSSYKPKNKVSDKEILKEYQSTAEDRFTVKELNEVFGLHKILADNTEYQRARSKADAEERQARKELAYEAYHDDDVSVSEIVDCLGVSKSTIYRDIKAYEQQESETKYSKAA